MSAAATLQAISLLIDLTTAASHMLTSANEISEKIKASGGALTDEQWQALRSEDLRLQAALADAINQKRKRDAAGIVEGD